MTESTIDDLDVRPVYSEESAEPSAAEPESNEPDQSRSKRKWRLLPKSLTNRLVAWVVGLVVLVVAGTSIATYAALHSFLYNRLDQQLQSIATGQPLEALFHSNTPFGRPVLQSPQRIWAVVLDSNGQVLVEPSGGVNPMHLSTEQKQDFGQRAAASSSSHGPESITTADGISLRVVTPRATFSQLNPDGSVASQQAAVAVVGLSTSETDRTLSRLIWLEVGIGSAAILLAGLVTTIGVRSSLRPLRRVTTTAREVTAELSSEGAGLERRVPETDPDTEVGQLAESFNTLLGSMQNEFAARVASEERMRQFLADASHELRTPLTSIRGYAELARMRGSDVPDGDTLHRIESEGTRMSRLVDDLLLLARSDRGAQPHYERVDVADVVADAVDGVRAAHPERRIDVAVEEGLIVSGDIDQLLRGVRNLVTNACVHTAEHGPIGVRAYADGADVIIQVDDSGPGLTPEQAEHVFERFWRADPARSRGRGGSGLGLAIVQSIIESHGGSVRFDSDVVTGSTVTVRIPAWQEATVE